MTATVTTAYREHTVVHDGISQLNDRTAITFRNMAVGGGFATPPAVVQTKQGRYYVWGHGSQAQARRLQPGERISFEK